MADKETKDLMKKVLRKASRETRKFILRIENSPALY